MRRVFAAVLLGALWLGPLASHAGYLIVDENGEQVLVSTGRLKMAPASAGGMILVLDVGRSRLWVGDSVRRRYWEGSVDEYCDGVRRLTTPPPAERPDAAGSARGPKVTVEPTAERQTIAGLPTRKFRVLANGTLYEELWLTSDPALMGELLVARAPDTFGRMSGCMAAAGGSPRIETTDEYRRIYAEGWPLKVVFHGEGKPLAGPAVVRVEPRDVSDAAFKPPPGFAAAPLREVLDRSAP